MLWTGESNIRTCALLMRKEIRDDSWPLYRCLEIRQRGLLSAWKELEISGYKDHAHTEATHHVGRWRRDSKKHKHNNSLDRINTTKAKTSRLTHPGTMRFEMECCAHVEVIIHPEWAGKMLVRYLEELNESFARCIEGGFGGRGRGREQVANDLSTPLAMFLTGQTRLVVCVWGNVLLLIPFIIDIYGIFS